MWVPCFNQCSPPSSSRCRRGGCFGRGLEVSCSVSARSKRLCPRQPDTECALCARVHVLCVHMCVCVVCACVYVLCVHMCACVVYARVCMCCVCTCVYVLCVYVCVCSHTRVYMCVYVRMHTWTSPSPFPLLGMLFCPRSSKSHSGHWSRLLSHH